MKHSINQPRRRGFALIVALVIMAVLAVLLTVVTMQVVSQRRLLGQRERQLQAEWFARAGVELAAARLLQNSAGFSEDKDDMLPDAKLRIVVEKSVQDLYAVAADAEVSDQGAGVVSRTARGRFRRTDSAGVVRLQAVP